MEVEIKMFPLIFLLVTSYFSHSFDFSPKNRNKFRKIQKKIPKNRKFITFNI